MSRLAQVLAPEQFGGSTYDPAKDGARLSKQLKSVLALMSDSKWRTAEDIAVELNLPARSIPALGARCRDLRKPPHNRIVDCEPVPGNRGLWRYRLRGQG